MWGVVGRKMIWGRGEIKEGTVGSRREGVRERRQLHKSITVNRKH